MPSRSSRRPSRDGSLPRCSPSTAAAWTTSGTREESETMTTHAGPDAAMAALTIGKTVTVRKTVGETDVYLFAGISGDFSPNHVDEEYMKATRYGRRIAHGALMVAYMSQASTKMCASLPGTIGAYGCRRIRFQCSVLIG